jgi:acetyltransferase
MDKIFYPASIVVVGVSEKADNLSKNIAENILRYEYKGDLYFLGRNAGQLHGLPIHTSVAELPRNIDLAVILTPAQTVPAFLEQLGQAGVHNALIETAGFSEFSEEGALLEQEIYRIAKKWDIKIVGPNCVGIISMESGINTLFVRVEKDEMIPGSATFISQSGGVVLTGTNFMTAGGLGVNKTVSVGNKLILKESDYLKYFLQDEATKIILLYLESIVEGREMVELAGNGNKPVIIYKSNTSQASSAIARSHTAALSNDDKLVSAALKQFGVTRVFTFREMINAGKGFMMPPVRGNKLAVFSRSGGLAIVSTDLANDFGFSLPAFPDKLFEIAKPFFRVNVIDKQNPLDLGTVFDFGSYPIILEETIKLLQPDAIVLVFNYMRESRAMAWENARKFKEMAAKYQTAIALVYLTEMEEVRDMERNLGYPIYTEVYDAIQSLALARDFYLQKEKRESLRKNLGESLLSVDSSQKAASILQNTASKELQIDQALQLCEAYGLPTAPWGIANSAQEAVQIAEKIGYPVVLKIAGSGSIHKTDVGGVALNLSDAGEITDGIRKIQSNLAQHGLAQETRFLVQKMIKGGREVIMGGKQDDSFGPMVLCGLGGIYAEVFQDVSLRLAPLSPDEALEMLSELRGAKYLTGVRGEKGVDLHCLARVMSAVSRMLDDFRQIAELDLNPLLAFEDGALIADARMVLK